MRRIVLDTETTGLDPSEGHRVIEIACVELFDRRPAGRNFHRYLNPERDIDGPRSRSTASPRTSGPYAQDDKFGSRKNNPRELYQNQVTREQGGCSLRMFHRSFSLLMLQANIEAPCTVLDFPSLEDFIREIRDHDYDIVGISSIIPNVMKAKKMCELIREYRPGATIVVGGHDSNMENINGLLDADYIVNGDGIQWFRRFLSQDEKKPVRHPMVYSGFGARIMGINLPHRRGRTAAILIPSVGCPIGCNFCSTSALFGGKGNFINYYETGDELFSAGSGRRARRHRRIR